MADVNKTSVHTADYVLYEKFGLLVQFPGSRITLRGKDGR